jgi:hypothetical protein
MILFIQKHTLKYHWVWIREVCLQARQEKTKIKGKKAYFSFCSDLFWPCLPYSSLKMGCSANLKIYIDLAHTPPDLHIAVSHLDHERHPVGLLIGFVTTVGLGDLPPFLEYNSTIHWCLACTSVWLYLYNILSAAYLQVILFTFN